MTKMKMAGKAAKEKRGIIFKQLLSKRKLVRQADGHEKRNLSFEKSL